MASGTSENLYDVWKDSSDEVYSVVEFEEYRHVTGHHEQTGTGTQNQQNPREDLSASVPALRLATLAASPWRPTRHAGFLIKSA